MTHGDARKHLSEILSRHNWKKVRGVLFLDPYGLQCTWDMVKDVAKTQALDVFFLVSVSGLTRQAATSAAKILAAEADDCLPTLEELGIVTDDEVETNARLLRSAGGRKS